MNTALRHFVRMVFALSLITAGAGLGLGVVYDSTAQRIAAQKEAAQRAGLIKALPGCEIVSEPLEHDGVPYWIAEGPSGRAYGFLAQIMGYQSLIQVVVGMDATGRILGLSIVAQAETPGLGARLTEVASETTLWAALLGRVPKDETPPDPWFAQQFVGLSLSDPIGVEKGPEWKSMTAQEQAALTARNGISALSGATISAQAVVDAIRPAARKLLAHLAEAPAHE